MNFVALEPEANLALGRLDRVRPVAHVAADVNGKVATDSARGRGQWVGSTENCATGLHDVLALPDGSNDRARAHVLEKAREEGLGLEVLVVLAKKLLGWLSHLEGNKLVPARLETTKNLRDESALDAVRLDHDEGLLGGRHITSK